MGGFFKQEELRLLWPFYLDSLLSPMLFFVPAFLIVYFRNLEFSLFQISLLIMMIPLCMLLFEIPTGVFADLYGRKLSVLLGTFIEGIFLFLIFFTHNFYTITLLFLGMGIGGTFISGAKEAWVADLLKKKSLLHNYFVKSRSFDSLGLVISGIVGAFLVKIFGLPVIWIVGGLSYTITFIILLIPKEHFTKKKTQFSYNDFKKQTSKSIKYIKNHKSLCLFLIALSLVAFAGIFSGDMAWVTLLQDLEFPEYGFGYLWSGISALGIIAPYASVFFMKKSKEIQFLLAMLFFTIFSLFFVFFAITIILALIIFLVSFFFMQMAVPVERTFFHKIVISKTRATIGSVERVLIGGMGLLGMPLAGLSIDIFGPKITIFFSALFLIPVVFLYYRIRNATTLKKVIATA